MFVFTPFTSEQRQFKGYSVMCLRNGEANAPLKYASLSLLNGSVNANSVSVFKNFFLLDLIDLINLLDVTVRYVLYIFGELLQVVFGNF